MATTERPPWIITEQRDFTGGENLKLLPSFVKPNQLVLAQNCVLTAEGVLETRPGKTRVNNVSLGAGPILGAWRFAKEDGSKYLVVQHGTSLYATEWDGATPFETFGTAVKSGLTANAKLRGVVWKDNLLLTNGVDNPFRFDGTSCTDLAGTPPKSKVIAIYGSRVWFVDEAYPSQIRFSGLEDFDTWDALDLIKIRDADGDRIRNLLPQNGGLVILKDSSAWVLYGTSRFDIRVSTSPLADFIGSASFDGAINYGLFLGQDNLYTVSLNALEPMPETHTPLIERLTAAQKAAVVAGVHPLTRRALFHLPTGATIVADFKYNAITQWLGLNASCFAVASAAGDDGALLIGDASNGLVYRLAGDDDDDGAAIDTFIKESYRDYDTPRQKVWRYFKPDIDLLTAGDNYDVLLKYDVDYKRFSNLEIQGGPLDNTLVWDGGDWDAQEWGPGVTAVEPFWLHQARGQRISFELRTAGRIRFRGYTTKFREAGAI